jgi:hypothetical protein
MNTTNTTETKVRYPNVHVRLIGRDGNAFSILARVQKELRRAKVRKSEIHEFLKEATARDYNDLLTTVMRWVEVE